MESTKKAVILVGHGGLPSDIPNEVVEKFMRLHKTRVKAGGEATDAEIGLDNTIRRWERTPESDPYKSGLELLASHMKPLLNGFTLKTAYNEFCYPTIEEAVEELATENFSKIVLVTTMITRGGSHSEREIPEELEVLRKKFKNIDINYAWPFDMDTFALFLATHVKIHDPLSMFANG
jgi:sirohydrochlorin cobaltochelatase